MAEPVNRLIVRAYWMNMSATDDYRPNDWRRPEFHEGAGPEAARSHLLNWLLNEPKLIRQMRDLRESATALRDDRHVAGEVVAGWLDGMLYSGLRPGMTKDERISVQLVADTVARAEFCRMDFGRLMDEVCAADV